MAARGEPGLYYIVNYFYSLFSVNLIKVVFHSASLIILSLLSGAIHKKAYTRIFPLVISSIGMSDITQLYLENSRVVFALMTLMYKEIPFF